MELTTIWFILISILWIGYFVLEGFDFGVGMLFPVLGRDREAVMSVGLDGEEVEAAPAQTGETRKRVMLATIGPVWDGNEVWLITAGGATFAAFPHWYATLFSGFYIPLLLILVALIGRALAFDYRGKVDSDSWRARWDGVILVGSAVPALLWGVAFTNIVRGVPIDADMEFSGTLFTLLNPVAVLGGLVTVSLFLTHGALFLALKTDGPIRHDARAIGLKVGLVGAVLAVVWLAIVHAGTGNTQSWIVAGLAALALVASLLMASKAKEGWAFIGTFSAIGLAVTSLFVALFPDVMPSTTEAAYSLTVINASATDYTLGIMTWVAVIFVPIVLLYQAWTYWAFRQRVSGHHIPTGVALAARTEKQRQTSGADPAH